MSESVEPVFFRCRWYNMYGEEFEDEITIFEDYAEMVENLNDSEMDTEVTILSF